jgi:hypothetical protein
MNVFRDRTLAIHAGFTYPDLEAGFPARISAPNKY